MNRISNGITTNLWFMFSLWNAFNLNPRSLGNFKWFDRKRKIIFAVVLGIGLAITIASLTSPAFAALDPLISSKKKHGNSGCEGELGEDSC